VFHRASKPNFGQYIREMNAYSFTDPIFAIFFTKYMEHHTVDYTTWRSYLVGVPVDRPGSVT